MKVQLNVVITFLLIIVSIGLIFNHQKTFDKITDWDEEHLDIIIFNENIPLMNNILSIGNDGLYTSILEHTLPLDINGSINIGKNDWLLSENTRKYINNFMAIYGYRGNIYQIVFNNIITDVATNKEVSSLYEKDMTKYLLKEKNFDIDNKYYQSIYNELYPLYCDEKYPTNKNLNNFYNLAGLYFFKNQDYKKAGCFILLSGYENKMDSWKTLTLSIYKDYIISLNDTNFDNYYKYTDMLYKLAENEKLLIINSDNIDIHRNTTKTNSLILINQVYTNTLNGFKQYYFKLKENEFK